MKDKEVAIPAWTGFQVETVNVQPKLANIGFMPAIPASPTQMNVIEEILNRTLTCMKELELPFIFLEVDQAIYNKVLQVLFDVKKRNSTKYDKVIVRMGGFHVIICLLRTLYSRFHDSGVVELLVEAGVGSEGSIRSAMKGSDVKVGIRCYKILFEALTRTKFDFIANSASQNHSVATLNDLANLSFHDITTARIESIIRDPNLEITTNERRHGAMDGFILEHGRSDAQCNTLSANWELDWIFGSHT